MYWASLGAMPVLNVLDKLVAFCGIAHRENELTPLFCQTQGDFPANSASVGMVGVGRGEGYQVSGEVKR